MSTESDNHSSTHRQLQTESDQINSAETEEFNHPSNNNLFCLLNRPFRQYMRESQQSHQLFFQFINYMIAPTCFGITLPSSGSVPSAF
jgi:hypothetical protein